MTSVDENRLKGNYAENQVSAWLSSHCLIRPVAEGTDIGIDLYCESIIKSKPHMHFWVQVKAINEKQIRNKKGEEEAWFDFDVKHLQYWLNQPIPVYVFLVPIKKWPPSKPEKIFVIRVSEHLVKHGIKQKSFQRLTSDGYFEIEIIDDEINEFISKIVPLDSSALLFKRGIIAPIEYPFETRYAHFPRGIGYRHLDKIITNIRDASVIGLIESLAYERIDPQKKEIRILFENVLKTFEEQLHIHPLGLSVLVRAAHDDGRIDDALKLLKAATNRLESDEDIPGCEKKNTIQKIRVLLEDFKDYKGSP